MLPTKSPQVPLSLVPIHRGAVLKVEAEIVTLLYAGRDDTKLPST